MASSRMISCRIFWVNISLPGRTLSPAMPGREPPKAIRNQIASIIHKDQEVTHIYLRKYTFIHFGISIPVAFEFIPFHHTGGRIPEQERSRCSRYHRQVKRGISNDAGETGSFDQIPSGPSCCLLACSWQDLLGTMSQLDSDQLNIATSVSINLIPHIITLYSWTELFSASLSISSRREEYLTNSKSEGMGW